jgi:hypothetical protein
MKISNIDSPALTAIRQALEPALQEIGEQYGITLTVGRGSYGGETGTLKIELATLGENGEAESPAAKEFKQCASMGTVGLEPTDLGRRFVSNGEEFEVSGLKMRNRKYPVLATKVSNGKVYKFSAMAVRIRLSNSSAVDA